MAATKDIMDSTGASKRKRKVKGVEQVCEYPNEVEACVVAKKQSARKAKKQPPAGAKDAIKTATSTSNSNQIEQDRTQIDARAQEKAARHEITENELVAYYLATGNFTNPQLKEQVKHSRKQLNNFLKRQYSMDTYVAYLLDLTRGSNIDGLEQWLKSLCTQPDKLDADESSD